MIVLGWVRWGWRGSISVLTNGIFDQIFGSRAEARAGSSLDEENPSPASFVYGGIEAIQGAAE